MQILVVEDEKAVGHMIAMVLGGPASKVVRASCGWEALIKIGATAQPFDVVITDHRMPRMTGLEVATELKRRRSRVRVVIVTTFARAGYLRRALDAGASAYLLKDRPADALADAVRRVHQGLRVIDPDLATEAWGDLDPLTDRERQVLRFAGEGMASGDIAAELSLSEGTVRNYLSEAISKLGASNRVEAARIARTKGWL